MTGLFLFAVCYLVCVAITLVIYPAPNSLKEPTQSIWLKLYNRKLSLLLTLSIGIIHLFASDFSFLSTSGHLSQNVNFYLSFQGMILGSFVHTELIHLLSNAIIIILLGHFEEQVGAVEYLTVLGISILVSSLSIFPLLYKIPSIGISGGCFGLVAGFLVCMSRGEKRNLLFTTFAVGGLIIYSVLRTSVEKTYVANTDHLAHFMGALSILIFYKLKYKKFQEQPNI